MRGKVTDFGIKKPPDYFHIQNDLINYIFCGRITPDPGKDYIGKILFRANQVILFTKKERQTYSFEFDVVAEFFDSKKLLALNLKVLRK